MGASGYAPENTLLSFREAMRIGCHRTEMDVRLTKDGIPVVIHDETVDRTTNGHGSVSEMTLAEIKTLFCAQGQKIPTLQEVIDLCKDKIDLQIELKEKGTPLKVNKLLEDNGMNSGVLITSFNADLLKEMTKINPNLLTGLLFRGYPENFIKIAYELRLAYICLKASSADRKIIANAHGLRFKVYAYHANNQALGEDLIRWGIDDIGTDFPKRYNKFLVKV